jgi:nucleotide-binding universal stress UspA family protein
MFRHILLPSDGSELATAAVEKGIALAKVLGARVTVLTVVERFHVMSLNPTQLEESLATYHRHAGEHAVKVLGDAEAKAAAAGVGFNEVTRTGESPSEEINEVAAEIGADLIAMASHGRRGLSALMIGSQTARVVSQSSVPVLVFR